MDRLRTRSHVSLEDEEEETMDGGAPPPVLPVEAYLERRDVETAAATRNDGAATTDPKVVAPRAGDAASANGNGNGNDDKAEKDDDDDDDQQQQERKEEEEEEETWVLNVSEGTAGVDEKATVTRSASKSGKDTENHIAAHSAGSAELADPTTTTVPVHARDVQSDARAESLDRRASVRTGPTSPSAQSTHPFQQPQEPQQPQQSQQPQPPTQPAAYAPYSSGAYGWNEPSRDVKGAHADAGPPAYEDADMVAQSYSSSTRLSRPIEMTMLGAGADARRPSSSLNPTYQPAPQPANGFPEHEAHRNSLAWVVNPPQAGAVGYDGTMAAKPEPPPFDTYGYGGGPRASYDSNADRGPWTQGMPPAPPMESPSASQTAMLDEPPVPPPPAEDLVPAVPTRQWYEETPNRHAFIRKVYLILLVQLSLTVAWCAVCLFVPSVQSWVQTEYGMMVAVMVLSFVILIVLFCVRKIVPWNYICLFIFTLMMSYSIGAIVSYYDSLVVLQAVLVTAGIFVCLTAFTLQSRYDFSSWGPYLFVFLLCFVLSGIVYAFLPFNTVAEYFYCSLGALLFSLYIIFDTYMIVNRLSQEEYILGAIDLYVDILNLFLMILRLFGAANN